MTFDGRLHRGTDQQERQELASVLTDLQNQIDALGPSGGLNSGITTVDFGAFPGTTNTSVAVTGQASISKTSMVHAFLISEDSADHTADEHAIESIRVTAGNIIAGTGFTIYATQAETLPVSTSQMGSQTNSTPRIYGVWNVGWFWA